jgi:hypothetical protein
MAWSQQIDKEFSAAETNRLRYLEQGLIMSGGSSTNSNPFVREPNIARPKIAPHLVTGFLPVDTKFQQSKEEF